MRRRTPRRICSETDMEIKKREILFGAIIALVMVAVGFFISGAISEHMQANVEQYTTAVRIEDPDQFSYGMKTDFGNALVYGTLQAEQPVIRPELDGEYVAVRMVKERYTMHTRTVTYTDSDGNTRTRTETYWTWDYAGENKWVSDTILFLGSRFATNQFNLSAQYRRLNLKDKSRYLYESSHVRYYFTGIPTAFDATIHADLRAGGIGQQVEVFPDKTPAEVVETQIHEQKVSSLAFWMIWISLIVIIEVLFVT